MRKKQADFMYEKVFKEWLIKIGMPKRRAKKIIKKVVWLKTPPVSLIKP